jgi:chaperonin GroEL
MNIKEIKFGAEQMELQKAGLDIMANAVKVTLGPKGQTVTIQKHGKAKVTKDGVSVAREVSVLDQFKDQGAQLALETCIKSNNVAGDGTTTAIVLAQALMDGGMAAIKGDGTKPACNPIDVKHGIEMATTKALTHLISMAREVSSEEQLLQVGNISSNGDRQISKVIVEALDKAGKNGMVTYQESSNLKTTLNVVSGYHFARGYHSQDYCNVPNKLECVLENALILVTSIRLNYWKAIEPYVMLSNELGMPLLIVADELEGECKAILLKAAHARQVSICVVRAPLTAEHRDQVMEDIATYTGGEYIRHDKGDKLDFDPNNQEQLDAVMKKLGRAKRIVVNRETTTIVGGNRNLEKFEEYCEGLLGAQKEEQNIEVKAFLQERLARLTSGIVEILVGGTTETETKERKDRVEDALSACRAAKEEGILPGGGIALLRVSKMSFDDLSPQNEGQKAGIEVVKKALTVPIKQLAINAGVDPEFVLKKIELHTDKDHGWDVAQNYFGNMYALGVVDPLKVVRSALEGASSIAALMLGNGCTIVDHVTMQPSGQLSPLINI